MSLSTVRRRWEGSFQEGGKLHGLPYIPLSKLRNTHTMLCQGAGMLDSMDRSMHRNTGAVQQRYYLNLTRPKRPSMSAARFANVHDFRMLAVLSSTGCEKD